MRGKSSAKSPIPPSDQKDGQGEEKEAQQTGKENESKKRSQKKKVPRMSTEAKLNNRNEEDFRMDGEERLKPVTKNRIEETTVSHAPG